MLEVFFAVLPVFMILGVGIVLDRAQVLAESFSAQLTQFVFKIAMPCMLFRMVSGAQIASFNVAAFLLALLVSQIVLFIGSYAWATRGFKQRTAEAAIITLACVCANSGFLGLPIIDSLMPGNHEAMAAGGLSCTMPPLMLVWAHAIVEMGRRTKGEGNQANLALVMLKTVLLNPFIVAAVLGMLVSVSDIAIWTPAERVLALIGSTAAPCALVALGLDIRRKVAVARRAASPHRIVWQSGIALIKLVVHPALTWAALSFAGVQGVWLAVGVLMTGTSTAVMAYVLGEISGAIPEEAALAVVITAFISMFSIPAFALALKAAGYM